MGRSSVLLRLEDLPNYLNIELKESLADRFMDDPALYTRFLRKLLTVQEFKQLEQAASVGNWAETLRLAHNLKGVCANLGLVALRVDFEGLVALLRTPHFAPQLVRESLEQLRLDWHKAQTYISQLEA